LLWRGTEKKMSSCKVKYREGESISGGSPVTGKKDRDAAVPGRILRKGMVGEVAKNGSLRRNCSIRYPKGRRVSSRKKDPRNSAHGHMARKMGVNDSSVGGVIEQIDTLSREGKWYRRRQGGGREGASGALLFGGKNENDKTTKGGKRDMKKKKAKALEVESQPTQGGKALEKENDQAILSHRHEHHSPTKKKGYLWEKSGRLGVSPYQISFRTYGQKKKHSRSHADGETKKRKEKV